MKGSYGEGLATQAGPESCGAAREGCAQALTEVRAGRVLSRQRSFLRGAVDSPQGQRGSLIGAHGALPGFHLMLQPMLGF